MVSSDLGACEWFVWDLRRSGLIDRGQLDQVIGEFLRRNPRAEPPALAEYLVAQQVLTPYQAQRILDSKTQGLVLGPYVLADTIGAGSMGQVYKATSRTDNQWYAVKVLPRRSMWNVRLARRQVRAFAAFTQTAVVPFVDVGTSGGLHYLVWPLVDGETLESRMARDGRLSPQQTAVIGMQLATGLSTAHQNGLFHGLLKPSNVMISRDGQARILDFGIGSLLVENEGESLVDTMSTANTLTSGLDCAAPESILEPTTRTPAGDQYSLGCVLYYCLTGKVPFDGESAVEKMISHQFKQPIPLREITVNVPEGLVLAIDRLMQKSPESRFAGCDEVVEALQPFAIEASQRRGFGGPVPSLPQTPMTHQATNGSSPLSSGINPRYDVPRPAITPPPSGPALPGVSRSPMPQYGPASMNQAPSASGNRIPSMPQRPQAPQIQQAPQTPQQPLPRPSLNQIPAAPMMADGGAGMRASGNSGVLTGASLLPERSTPIVTRDGIFEEAPPRRSMLVPLLIVIGAATLVISVYLLGKRFLG